MLLKSFHSSSPTVHNVKIANFFKAQQLGGVLTARRARADAALQTQVLPPQNLIQRSEYGQRIADALQLKDRSPAPTLEPSIQPVVVVDDLSNALEGRNNERRRYSASHAQGSLVGNATVLFLINHPNSQHVGLVQSANFSTPTAPDPANMLANVIRIWFCDQADFAAKPQQNAFPWNQRQAEYQAGVNVSFNNSSLRAQGTNMNPLPTNKFLLGDYYCAQQLGIVDLRGMVIVPGAGLMISTADTAFGVRDLIGGFVWDEVPINR